MILELIFHQFNTIKIESIVMIQVSKIAAMVFAVAGATACFAECETPAEEKPKTEADATTGTDATETTAGTTSAAQ